MAGASKLQEGVDPVERYVSDDRSNLGADFIQEEIDKRRKAKEDFLKQEKAKEDLMRKVLAKRLKKITVVKKKPLWWVPGVFGNKIKMAQKIAELERALLDYTDHSAKQSQWLKVLYQWALDRDDGSIEEVKKALGSINPAQPWVGK
jgi:hypothetical protein